MNPGWRKNYLRYKAYLLNIIGHYKRRKDLKLYLEIFLSLATISLFAIFALRPTLLTIAGLIKEIDAKKTAVENMDQKIANLSIAQEIYNTQIQNIDLLANAVPNTPKPESYERQIENLAVKNEVTLNSVTIDEVMLFGTNTNKTSNKENESNHDLFTTTISAKGSYQSINQFVADIIALLRPIKIETLNISTPHSSKDGEALSLILNIKVPFIPEQ